MNGFNDNKLPDFGDDVEVIYMQDELEDLVDEEETESFPGVDEIETSDLDSDIIFDAEVVDLSKLSFCGHSSSVFCGDLSPDGEIVATGGGDDIAYIWRSSNGEVLLECTGHKDSVTEVAFNYNGQYVATGDMGGLIQVWNVFEKLLVWCFEGDDLEWLTWHHAANVLIAGSQSGDVFVWQIPQGNSKVLGSHGSTSTCGKLLHDGKRIVVGYGDGNLKLWDIKEASVIWQIPDLVDITSIETNSDGSLLAIAPVSKVIKVSDGKVIGDYCTTEKPDIEAILFEDELGILVTGCLSGQISVWDVGKKTLRHKTEIGFTITCFAWGTKGILVVGTTNGSIYIYDVRSGTILRTITGHKDDILSMKVAKDKSFVLTTSDDCSAKVFNINSN
ncbi:angio-associated migratory cell protein [Onthophagus taurus]|uniref:angio-associated migratory cell protein n=1 Tax=Onthophagus taurus TaxID=166361 RepID=UPI0039BE627C